MFKNSIIIAIVTITIGLFTTSSFAQRPIPGQMSGLLPGAAGTTNNNTAGTIAKGGRINPGGGTSRATGVADLVYQSNGAFFGTAYAYNGSHFELYTTDGGVLKTYANSCKPAPAVGSVKGVVCTFGHFGSNGQLYYSGWTYIYDNGIVYLRWMYSYKSNFKYVDGDTGWVAFKPQS